MFGKTILTWGAALALTAAPVWAQDEGEDPFAAMAGMFVAEPLTAEQQARLPAAQIVVDRMMPPGTLGEVMQSMFGGVMDPLLALAIEPSAGQVAKELGYGESEIEMTEEQAKEAAAILDPAWTERRQREMTAMKGAMGRVMNAMEPAMRKGMVEAYAAAFSATELADVAAFFATPSGASYAKKSYALASDPRIMGAAMQAMPTMMEGFVAMQAEIEAATADLPARRAYGDLSPEQQRRLSELTGMDQDAIEAGMAAAAENRQADMPMMGD
jgi:hypothetical protein